jgi:hypothetical protein
MKIIIITLLFSLLAFSLQLDRVARSKNVKNKSTESLTSCPTGVFSVKVNFLSSNPSELNINLNALFDVRNLNPISKTLNTKGLVLTVDSIPNDLKQFFHQENGLNMLLFKHISDTFQSQNSNVGQSIVTKYRTADFKDYMITIYFPYDPSWDSISSSDLTKIVDWLNKYKNDKFSLMLDKKLYMLDEFSQYLTNKKTSEKWGADANTKKNEIQNLKNAITEINNKIQSLDLQKNNTIVEIRGKEAELVKAEAEKKANEADILTKNAELKSLDKDLLDLKAKQQNSFKMNGEYKQKYLKSLAEIKAMNTEYKEECEDSNDELTKSLETLKTKTEEGKLKAEDVLKEYIEKVSSILGQPVNLKTR